VTSRRGDIVVVFSRNPDTGALTHMETLKRTAADLDGAHAVTVSPDGQHVYVTADNTDRLLTFARDSGTGALTHVTTLNDNTDGVDGLENAVSAAFSPDGRYIYVAGLDDDSVSVFNRDSATGILTFVEVVRNTDN
jgi:6-phosphogluconolactonase (cycloisomerase 2 family)